MSAPARLWLGVLCVAAGGALVLASSGVAWARIVSPGSPVRLPARTVFVGGTTQSLRGSDATSWVIVLGVVLVGAAAGSLLAGPRGRPIVLGLAAVAGALAVAAAARYGGSAHIAATLSAPPPGTRVVGAAGDLLAMAGGAAAVLGCAVALTVARTVARLRLPEGAPGP